MSSIFTRLAIQARHNAGLTQEGAAEQLGLSRRGLAYYEQGKIPNDTIVAKMMQVYNSPLIGYVYLSENTATGQRLLPPIKTVGVSSGAMQLRINLKKAAHEYENIEMICSDDIIQPAELGRFSKCISSLDGLISSILSLKMLKLKRNQKKMEGI